MKKYSAHISFYAVMLIGTALLLAQVLNFGSKLGSTSISQISTNALSWPELLLQELNRNMSVPLTGFLIQILVIIIFSRICAFVLKTMGQPRVIGEMIAGILLGRSVLGLFWKEGFTTLFPEHTLSNLYFLSQIGLILFMFVVGLDLKISDLKNRAPTAVLVSHASIICPFILGTLISLFLYDQYGPHNFGFSSFALFMGISMSITAFPVLARIIQEKNLMSTPLGTMAITCAAVDDVTAWCILAAVLGIVKAGTMVTAIGVLVLSVLYVLGLLFFVKPMLAKVLKPNSLDGKINNGQLVIIFCVLLGSALISEIIGIHALFGAFLAGTIMPQAPLFRSSVIEKIEDLSTVVLLPIFFAYTGIRTQIGLLDSVEKWLICLGIIVFAIIGKMVGSALAAKYSGMNWRDSWALGLLMNTRGLMELVVLNIGYDLGILSPTIFAMMVVMALVTTTMAGPLLSLILPELKKAKV